MSDPVSINGSTTVSNGNAAAPPQIELLSAWFCPYAQRAWIALEEKKCAGLEDSSIEQFQFTVTEATTRSDTTFTKSALLLEKNPKALVPVILDRRFDEEVVVCESLICVEYVDEALGNDEPTGIINGSKRNQQQPSSKLLPGPPSQRAHARMWVDKLNHEICGSFYSLLLQQHKAGQDMAAQKLMGGIRAFSRRCQGPYFYGEQFSMVDIAIAPWVAGIRMDVVRHYRNFEVPREEEEYEKYWEWKEAVENRRCFVNTACTDLDAMLSLYRPYAEGRGYSSR
mmetsp:Transcript_39168/g.82380  ORF Transcript_39168/g.82380 Transcript_39168/m.82380 type:complete len:283 (-) Transcript_39168:380-1228(-)